MKHNETTESERLLENQVEDAKGASDFEAQAIGEQEFEAEMQAMQEAEYEAMSAGCEHYGY